MEFFEEAILGTKLCSREPVTLGQSLAGLFRMEDFKSHFDSDIIEWFVFLVIKIKIAIIHWILSEDLRLKTMNSAVQ